MPRKPAKRRTKKLTPIGKIKRKAYRQKIESSGEPVVQEQFRQQVLVEAVDLAQKTYQESLARKVADVRKLKIEWDVLKGRCMEIVLALDIQRFPTEVMNGIKLAAGLDGIAKVGQFELVGKEEATASDGPGTYTALFNRLALQSSPESSLAPPGASGEVFDIIPQEKPPAPIVAPPPTEQSDTAAKGNSRIISVEVE